MACVDPLIGTDSVGTVYPGASAPFGMVQLSPDNGHAGWHHIAGYYYPDSLIASFSHTHLSGTGAGDMYDVAFMPLTLPALYDDKVVGNYYAHFSHEQEQCHAGYYAVTLQPYDIRVELTATTRVGAQRYTYLQGADTAMVRVDLGRAINWDRTTDSHIDTLDVHTLQGHRFSDGWARNQRLFFQTRLSQSPDSIAFIREPIVEDADTIGHRCYANLYYYHLPANATLELFTALSGVDAEGAARNLAAEVSNADFDGLLKHTEQAWNEKLAAVQIEGATDDERTKLYTALYRTMICPTTYSDVDGRYLGPDGRIHQLPEGRVHYSTFSLWDTYRAEHPLLELIATRQADDMARSMLDFAEQNQGILPIWNMWASETDMMIGHHSISVVVSAMLKEITPTDSARVKALLLATTNRPNYRGLDAYRRLGYVPADSEGESVSKTLEYAYDDAAVAAWARFVGDSLMAQTYTRRAQSYTHLWDATSGFFRPRMADGAWLQPFSPFAYTKHYTESNAYQYLFSVQHDVPGLCNLMGGADKMAEQLDELFTTSTPDSVQLPIFSTGMIGQYPHGNEPAHHVLYLYNLVRQPWKAADLAYQITDQLYTTAPDGLCGNEDCGQMSAWYVFTSLGLYPLYPVDGLYWLVSPRYPRSTVQLDNGKTIEIVAENLSATHRYIAAVELDGEPWQQPYVPYERLVRGCQIKLHMTAARGKLWY